LTINAVLANGLVTFPDGVTFEINPERTLFVAADNTLGTGATGDYAARFALDKSTLDRFVRMVVDYDNDVERTMAINGWRTAGGLPEQEDAALSWYQEVVAMRAAVAKARIDVLISPRATETGAALLAQGMPFDDVKHDLLLIDLSEDQIKQLAV
jgi:cobaltochelatase CobS